MNDPSRPLAEAIRRFDNVAAEITGVYTSLRPAPTDPVTPPQLIEAVQQFLAVADKLDREEGPQGPIEQDDPSQLGEYGITLLDDLGTWTTNLGLSQMRGELTRVTIAAADWVVRHSGEIRALDPVVNALADAANNTHEPVALEQLTHFMGQVIDAVSPPVRQDQDQTDPNRPWRLLHLNRAITATRSYNPTLMAQVFEDMIAALPQDASSFFAEGMRQMKALGYPEPVQVVMRRYHQRFSNPTLH